MKKDKKDLTVEEMFWVNKTQDQLEGISKNKVINSGGKTRKLLDTLGIKSPSLKGIVEVVKGTWILPKVKLNNEKEKQVWIRQMKKKFKLR